MSKEKDPAFLFYSKDFYEGTRMMLPEERACYIDLMIYQHQNGFIPDDPQRMTMYCSGISKAMLIATLEAKFKLCDKGWYSQKLAKVMEERQEFSKKQAINGTVGQFFKKAKEKVNIQTVKKLRELKEELGNDIFYLKYLKDCDLTDEASLQAMLIAMLKHLEDANEDVIVNKDIYTKEEISKFINEALKDDIWLEATQMLYRLTKNIDVMKYLLSQFAADVISKKKPKHKDADDLKGHFSEWLKYQRELINTAKQEVKNNETVRT